ncbi:Serine/threonine-protein kinase plk4 [Geranomyces variabilis]|uniref:Aurora kinase n=1 Tax=Geranomyces variabilis TaxID=109894 RepID=A0AAD5XN47_9FUNG|nr:Serine/threonine-protein kinase plk4 [Geranomyces variabilis]
MHAARPPPDALPARRPLAPASNTYYRNNNNSNSSSSSPKYYQAAPLRAAPTPQQQQQQQDDGPMDQEFSFTSPRKASTRRFSSRIDDYEIGEMLGRGGFGFVHRAVSKSAGTYGREVAIKMIDKRLMKAANMTRRVANEVEVHWQLHHPSILELYNYFEDNSYVYLVMEICQNGELYQYIHHRKCPLTEPEARGVVAQVVRGLLYLHAHGIIHRDLKLSNLLLTENLDVKIADFGLAVKLNELDGEQKTMCGTPNYISPEIISRLPYGLTSDVWSLGCMVVTLLTGKPPFESKAVKSTLDKVTRVEYTLPANLSTDVKDLVHRLLQKDPKKRLALTKVLNHPFFNPTSPVSSLRPLSAVFDSVSNLRKKPSLVQRERESQASARSQTPRGGGGSLSRGGERPPSVVGALSTRANADDARGYSARARGDDKENAYEGQGQRSASSPMRENARPSRTFASDRSRATTTITAQPSVSSASGPAPPTSSSHASSLSSHAFATSSSPQTSASSSSARQRARDWPHAAAAVANNPRRATGNTAHAPPPAPPAPPSSTSSPPATTTTTTTPPTDLPAFSTARLNPLKQKTKHGTVTITPRGDLVLDFFGEEFLMVISGDSAYVRLFDRQGQGRGGGVVDAAAANDDDDNDDDPTVQGRRAPARSYKRTSLPVAYAKKFRYASRFVDLVRSKTPKIIFYSPQAKCVLMENSPQADFEALFYNGTRAHYSASTGIIGIKIPRPTTSSGGSNNTAVAAAAGAAAEFEKHEIPISPPANGSAGGNARGVIVSTDIPQRLGPVVRHVQECFKQCVDVERSVDSGVETAATGTTFPVILKSSHCRAVATTAGWDYYQQNGGGTRAQAQRRDQQYAQEGDSFHPSAMSTYTRTVVTGAAVGYEEGGGGGVGRSGVGDDRRSPPRARGTGTMSATASVVAGGGGSSHGAARQSSPRLTERTNITTATATTGGAPASSASSPHSLQQTAAGIPIRATVSDNITLSEHHRRRRNRDISSPRPPPPPASDDGSTSNRTATTTTAARSTAAASAGASSSCPPTATTTTTTTAVVASLNFHHLVGVGWCVKTADGKFVMLFDDGVRNVVDPRDQTLEVTEVCGGGEAGGMGEKTDTRTTRFTIDKYLPEHAKAKLAFFPQFLRLAGFGTRQNSRGGGGAAAGGGRGAGSSSSASAVAGPATRERSLRATTTASSESGIGAAAAMYYRRQ